MECVCVEYCTQCYLSCLYSGLEKSYVHTRVFSASAVMVGSQRHTALSLSRTQYYIISQCLSSFGIVRGLGRIREPAKTGGR